MIRKRILLLLVFLCSVIMLAPIVGANILQPTITHVYFEKDGVPYNDPVKYSVTCYGSKGPNLVYSTPAPPGSYEPTPVFRYSATCNGYGCPVYEQYFPYWGPPFDWCDLEGKTGTRTFTLHNFSATPTARCSLVADRIFMYWGNKLEYYYYTAEFQSCTQFEESDNNGRIWVGHANFTRSIPVGITRMLVLEGCDPMYTPFERQGQVINKSDIISTNLDQYIHYLENCNPTVNRNCPGWMIEGKPLKLLTQYRTLKNNVSHLKENPCDTFLVKADPSLIIPLEDQEPWTGACASGGDWRGCNYTASICEARFTIPSDEYPATWGPRATSAIPTSRTGSPVPTVTGQKNVSNVTIPAMERYKKDSPVPPIIYNDNASVAVASPHPTPGWSPDTHRGMVESLFCSILSRFDISCDNV